MPAQDIGPTWGDWADAAFCVELGTKSWVISRTDSKKPDREALDFLPAVKGLMAAGSEDVWRMDEAFPTTRA